VTAGTDQATPAPLVTVMLVDDHQLVRAGLAQLVESAPDLTVVAQAPDGRVAVEEARNHRPDVVLMDLSMPVMDGVQATREVVRLLPATKVVVLTSFVDQDRVHEAMDAGAVGYLLKDSDPATLLAAVRSAAAGHVPLDPRVAGALLPRGRTGPAGTTAGASPDLSPREREVLTLIAQGMANKQIARRLGITERTVKAHLTSAYQRIGVADRTQAALWAQRHDLGSP
jgi:DNA-binding NarL/FixJ family response regulator